MKKCRPNRARHKQEGVALLISIFILLLISVVAIALIVSSGTESALAGNYRSSTGVYYAALAGLEEARVRLQANDPNSFKSTWAAFYPPPGTALPIGKVGYVLNPSPTENAGTLLTVYADGEYDTEFGPGALGGATVLTTSSVWQRSPLNTLPIPGPLYKWIRINAVSEKSLKLDVDADALADSTTPLYYDTTNLRFSNDSSVGPQLFEITSLAALPNGSQKIVQYLATRVPLNLSFPAALTLDGTNVPFSVPTSTNFWVSGDDHDEVGSCEAAAPPVPAVGYVFPSPGDSSKANILAAIPGDPAPAPPTPDLRSHYPSGASPVPSVSQVGIPASLQSVSGLNALVQTITQNADTIVTPTNVDATGLGTATQADLPAAMTSTNPMTVVVNGNLDVHNWHGTGYGLLLVTGEFRYDPDASWMGIVLVIGVGKLSSSFGGTGVFHGAVFLAKTMDTSSNPYTPLPNSAPLGAAFFDFTPGSGGQGVYYSNCWIQASIPPGPYKIVSFHEISQ